MLRGEYRVGVAVAGYSKKGDSGFLLWTGVAGTPHFTLESKNSKGSRDWNRALIGLRGGSIHVEQMAMVYHCSEEICNRLSVIRRGLE